jgi:hypothetical protein
MYPNRNSKTRDAKKTNKEKKNKKRNIRLVFIQLAYFFSKYPHLPQLLRFVCSAKRTPAPHFGQFLIGFLYDWGGFFSFFGAAFFSFSAMIIPL